MAACRGRWRTRASTARTRRWRTRRATPGVMAAARRAVTGHRRSASEAPTTRRPGTRRTCARGGLNTRRSRQPRQLRRFPCPCLVPGLDDQHGFPPLGTPPVDQHHVHGLDGGCRAERAMCSKGVMFLSSISALARRSAARAAGSMWSRLGIAGHLPVRQRDDLVSLRPGEHRLDGLVDAGVTVQLVHHGLWQRRGFPRQAPAAVAFVEVLEDLARGRLDGGGLVDGEGVLVCLVDVGGGDGVVGDDGQVRFEAPVRA